MKLLVAILAVAGSFAHAEKIDAKCVNYANNKAYHYKKGLTEGMKKWDKFYKRCVNGEVKVSDSGEVDFAELPGEQDDEG